MLCIFTHRKKLIKYGSISVIQVLSKSIYFCLARGVLLDNGVTFPCYTFKDSWTRNGLPYDSTIPPYLLPCLWDAQRWHCNARLKSNILCIIATHTTTHYQQRPSHKPSCNLWNSHIATTKFMKNLSPWKTTKHQPLVNSLIMYGWKHT